MKRPRYHQKMKKKNKNENDRKQDKYMFLNQGVKSCEPYKIIREIHNY